MSKKKRSHTPHYTASDTADYYRYLKDAAYLTEKVYKEWLTHPNHDLIAKFESENTPIPEDLQKRLEGFKKRGEQLKEDMLAARRQLDRALSRLGRAKIRKAAESYRRPHRL